MPAKPTPPMDPWTRPYWEAAREQRLLLQFCPACANHIFYPRRYCPFCDSDQLEWRESAGTGKIYAYTIVRSNAPSAFIADIPYVIAVVRLDEGPQMMSNIVGCDPDDVRSEMAVEVVFDKLSDTLTLPKFKPARNADARR